MNSLFFFRENVHKIRNFQILSNNKKKTVRYGFETVSHRSPFLWANLPQDYMQIYANSYGQIYHKNFFTCLQSKKKEVECLNLSDLQALRSKLRFYLNLIRKI